MSWERVKEHYQNPEVKSEIAKYCRKRWVAIHCEERDSKGFQLMIRYEHGRNPLTIRDEGDLARILEKYSKLRPRAFYATAHTYRKIESMEDVMDRGKILRSAPTWDIDLKDGDWRKIVKKALEIIDVLEKCRVSRSVFFKWSGRGAHVHVNSEAFSEDIMRKINPLDIAYSITQYVINRLKPETGIVVENKIDVQRVFTTPLSLHRSVNRVAVCVPPEELENFHISWTNLESYKHFRDSWRRFEEGEGDELAEKAYAVIGPYVRGRSRRRRRHKPLDREILEAFEKFKL